MKNENIPPRCVTKSHERVAKKLCKKYGVVYCGNRMIVTPQVAILVCDKEDLL